MAGDIDILKPEGVVQGVTKRLKYTSFKTLHLTVQEIVDFLYDKPIDIGMEGDRLRWHLRECQDCVVVAQYVAAVKCCVFKKLVGKSYFFKIDMERFNNGFERYGVRIKPMKGSPIEDYLLLLGGVDLAHGKYDLKVTPPPEPWARYRWQSGQD